MLKEYGQSRTNLLYELINTRIVPLDFASDKLFTAVRFQCPQEFNSNELSS